MAAVQRLTDAHVVLLAVKLCNESNVETLRALRVRRPDVLSEHALFRIVLTFLPEDTEPSLYTPLLQDITVDDAGQDLPDLTIDSSIQDLSNAAAENRFRQLRFLHVDTSHNRDLLADFLIQRAHQLDQATGDLKSVLQLVEPFVQHSESLKTWLINTLIPLFRKNYEYYPHTDEILSLAEMEVLRGTAGVEILLQHTKSTPDKTNIGRDLRGLIGPWKFGGNPAKRRRVSSAREELSTSITLTSKAHNQDWRDVNEWLLATSQSDFSLATNAITLWDGPGDVDLGGYAILSTDRPEALATYEYCQTAIATIYAAESPSREVLDDCWKILRRVTDLRSPTSSHGPMLSHIPPDVETLPSSFHEVSRTALLHKTLLEPDNVLTVPSDTGLQFLAGLCHSLQTLQDLSHPVSPRSLAELCLFGTEERQKQELQKLLQRLMRTQGAEADWQLTRQRLLWLRSWRNHSSGRGNEETAVKAPLGKLNASHVEEAFLKALLVANQYQAAVAIYVRTEDRPLLIDDVETCVQEAVLNAYDNASNGNRSRGGIKRASDILTAFKLYFPHASGLREIEHLIAATHALSFYHLTLQHGVPFQPVSIRVHQDPLSLVEKVLEQNSKAYTKLDDLLFIGRELVLAGLPTPRKSSISTPEPETLESKTFDAEHRITYLAITSALSSNDFDTAYSYILTRLSPSPIPTPSPFIDDTSWRAAYAAGRHRPASSPQSLPARISNLSKRMDLLSLALTLAPTPDSLSDILGTWRRCEEEMNALRATEAAEEKAWDSKGDDTIPGGFAADGRDVDMAETRREREKRATTRSGGGGYEEEAPMGLFDVARGAARAIGKSAFPLRAASGPPGMQIRDRGDDAFQDAGERPMSAQSGEEQRVRKRDMVSGMVTGGLKSGLGWVLGAPADREEG